MFGSVRNFRLAKKTTIAPRKNLVGGRFHLQRAEAEVRVGSIFGSQGYVSIARVLLTDVSDLELRFFSPSVLQEGTPISITMEIPVRFYAKAKVRWCKEVPHTGRVISSQPYRYRVCVELVFESDEQRNEVRGYTNGIRKDYVVA